MSKNKEKEHSKITWFVEVFIITFALSICFSYISTYGVSNLNLVSSIIILIAVIAVGIVFDIVGVAVTVAKEHEFHAKATKKVKGSKDSIKLIKNAPKVANICADVIGDICGVLSALVSALTVSGKAFGKDIANKKSTEIVHKVGIVLNKFSKK